METKLITYSYDNLLVVRPVWWHTMSIRRGVISVDDIGRDIGLATMPWIGLLFIVFVGICVYIMLELGLNPLFFISNDRYVSVSILLLFVMLISSLGFLASCSVEKNIESIADLLGAHRFAASLYMCSLLCFLSLVIINVERPLVILSNIGVIATFSVGLLLCCIAVFIIRKRIHRLLSNASICGATLYELAWLIKTIRSTIKAGESKKEVIFLITPNLAEIGDIVRRISPGDSVRSVLDSLVDTLYGSRAVFMLNYEALRRTLIILKIKAIIKSFLEILLGIMYLYASLTISWPLELSIFVLCAEIVGGLILTVIFPLFATPIITYFYWLFLTDFVGKLPRVVNPILGVIMEIVILALSFLLYIILVGVMYIFDRDRYIGAKIRRITAYLSNLGLVIHKDNVAQAGQLLRELYNVITKIVAEALGIET